MPHTSSRAHHPHRRGGVVREGALIGAVGATGVALWFFVLDGLRGALLDTPARLGEMLGSALALPALAESTALAVVGYTLFHYLAFAALGVAAVAVAHRARTEPSVLAAALLVFVMAEVGFYGLIALLHATALPGALTWLQIGVGNLVGSALVGATLCRAHPELRVEFAHAMGGADR